MAKGKRADGNPPGFIQLEGEDEEPKGKQKRLPEMEDAEIEEIEEAARAYVSVRDKRIAASRKEIDAKDTLLDVLKKHKKKHYHHGALDCEIVPEGERLRVKITEEED